MLCANILVKDLPLKEKYQLRRKFYFLTKLYNFFLKKQPYPTTANTFTA